jgi:hypothetical protein
MQDAPCTIFPPVIHLLTELGEPSLHGLPWQCFPHDWHGIPVPSSIGAAFRLASDGRWLRFEARAGTPPSPPAPGEISGAFREELWTRDVAEVFLAEEGSTQYTEWNLSPHGAWWAQGFAAPRVRAPDFAPPDSVKTWHEHAPDLGWSAGILFPLPPNADLESLRINVTMILGNGPRRYFATAILPGATPDFHIIKWFPKPTLKKN